MVLEHQLCDSLEVGGEPGKRPLLVHYKCLHLQMRLLASETQVFTFNVDSGENVLKRCRVQQIANFLL